VQLLLLAGLDLGLFLTSDLLSLGLKFLSGLSVVDLGFEDFHSSKSVFRFVLEEIIVVVIDQNETSSSATTEMSVEAESDDVLDISLELLGDEFSNSLVGDISLAGMEDFQDHLLSGEKSVQ